MLTGCLFIVIKVIQKLLYSKKRSKLLLTLFIHYFREADRIRTCDLRRGRLGVSVNWPAFSAGNLKTVTSL